LASAQFLHITLNCKDPIAIERFYAEHFGFKRVRVCEPGPNQLVVITSGTLSSEFVPAAGKAPTWPAGKAGPKYHGLRHLAFLVGELDAKLAELGDRVKIDLGPLDMSQSTQGMHMAWVTEPEGNILELNQGYVDEENPPPPP
jgi:glyoxylase I family protein